MATAASGNAGVGTIKVVTGDVKIIGVDGVARQAQVGDRVFAKETIQTAANSIVQVQLENGRMLDLGRDSKIALDNDVIGPQGPTATQAPATGDIAALQAQIAAGADPSKVAEATAAGGAPGAGGGGDGGGGSPVVIDQADSRGPVTSGFNTSPASIAFSTAQDPQFINRPPTIEGKQVFVSDEGLDGGNLDESPIGGDTTNFSTISGTLNINDIDGQPLKVTLSIPTDPLSSGGETIVWALSANGHTLTGTINGGSTTIITVNVDDLGHYQVTLMGPIDHPDTSGEDDLDVRFLVTVTDPFGASASANLIVTIEDDSPTLAACECEPILLYANDFSQGGEGAVLDGGTGAGVASIVDVDGDEVTIVNGRLRLTDESGGDMQWLKVDSGSSFEGSFTASFDVIITDTINVGPEGQTSSERGNADGFSFQVGNDVNTDGVAEDSQTSGFALTIDTYDNGDEPIPTIEVWFDGNLLDSFNNVPAELIYGGPLHVSVEVDGETYTVTITNDDGPVWSASGNMGGTLPEDADFYFGARTGADADIHEIDNVVITASCGAHGGGEGEGGQGGNTPNSENTPFTMASPTGFELPAGATPVGGIVVDLIGLNGVRVVTQLAASSLYVGFSDNGTPVGFRGDPLTIGIQSGFSAELLAQLGGGIDKAAVRFTLYDGDSSPGDFDDGPDNTLLLNGVAIGLWSDVNSLTTDGLGNPIGGVGTGFEDEELDTGWFYTDDDSALAALFTALQGSNQLVVQLDDIDPEDNFFDFTRGVDGSLINVGAGPAVVGENCVTVITAAVQEDGMDGVPTNDLSIGNKESGGSNSDDEAVSAAGSLRALFSFGADGPGDFVMLTDTSGLPELYSNGDEVSYSVSSNVLTATAGEDDRVVFTLTLNADGSWTFDLMDQLDHVDNDLNDENTALREGEEGSVNSIDFSSLIQATDGDGDKAPALPAGTFTITVEDDIPVHAGLEGGISATVREDGMRLFTTVDGVSGPILVQDDMSEGNQNPADTNADETDSTMAGSLAELVSAGADEELTFSIKLDEGDLPELYSQGDELNYEVSDDGHTLTAYAGESEDERTVFTLTVNEDGSWNFDLQDQLDHVAPPEGQNGSEFGPLRDGEEGSVDSIDFSHIILVTDADGDELELLNDGDFTINVMDDVPVAADGGEGGRLSVTAMVEEDGMSYSSPVPVDNSEGNKQAGDTNSDDEVSGGAGSLTALFSVGADEPATISLTNDDGELDTLPALLSKGDEVWYELDGNVLTAYAGEGEGERVVFTLTVNSNGSWSFDLRDQLDHVDDGNNNENTMLQVVEGDPVASIDFSLLLAVTDADGDRMVHLLNEGQFAITVQDDIPSVTVQVSEAENSITLTTQDAQTDGDPTHFDTATSSVNFGGMFVANPVPGADENVDITWNYELGITAAPVEGLVDSGLDSNHQNIYLYEVTDGNVTYIVGSTELTAPAHPEGENVVFNLSVNDNGEVTLTQFKQIDHANNNDVAPPYDDQFALLANGLVGLTGTATATDFDGDAVVSDGVTIDLGQNIRFADDGPADPLAVNKEINEGSRGSIDTNVMLILDVSGSMAGAGIATLKSSVMELLNKYDELGAVKVRIVTFSGIANEWGSGWLDIGDTSTPDTAKYIVNNLSADGATNYDDALLDAMTAFGTPGSISGAQNVSYFLSDGNPTLSNVNPGSNNHGGVFEPGLGDGIDGNGTLNEVSEQEWTDFLNANEIKSYALAMGNNIQVSNLHPIAYNGIGAGANMDGEPLPSFDNLGSIVLSPANTITGNLTTEGALTGVFGADGPGTPQFFSIVHDGMTYLASDANPRTFTTAAGGEFEFNFTTGVYKYTAPTNVDDDTPEVFTYAIIDGDGDTNSANLTITVLDGVPTAVADTVVAQESFLGLNGTLTESVTLHLSPASWTLNAPQSFDGGSETLNTSSSNTSVTQDTDEFDLDADQVDASHPASVSFTVGLTDWNSADRWSATLYRSQSGTDPVIDSEVNQSGTGNFALTGITQPGDYYVRFTVTDNSGSTSGRADLNITNLSYTAWTFTPEVTQTATIAVPNVFWNVVDIPGNVLTNDQAEADGVKVVTEVDGIAVSGATIIDGDYGTLSIDSTGAFTYTPDATDYTAGRVDTFSYTMRDGSSPADTSTAILTINLADHNYNPSSSGNTFLGGEDGNDTLNGNGSSEVVYGGAGNDTLNGGDNNDHLIGGTGNDTLRGDEGNDRLVGGDGNDTLQGGDDSDILVGGASADIFLWGNGDASDGGVDLVKDFNENAGDKLDLRDLLQTESHTGTNPGNLANFLHFSLDGGNTVIEVKTDGVGSVDQKIVLQGVDLTAGNTLSDNTIITNLLMANKLDVN